MKKIKSIFLVSLLVSTIFLTGCTSMNSQFDCNASSGGRCAPMNQINKMADYGMFREAAPQKETGFTGTKNQNYGYPLNTFAGAPIRNSENVQQIWIGPYEDLNGNYHEPSYVYAVIKKGSWIGEPAEAIQD